MNFKEYIMVYVARRETVLCLWWDPRCEYKEGYKYKVTVDDKYVVYTKEVFYDFQPLESGKEYNFTVQLVDENKNVVGKTENYTCSTLPSREKIDVTKPPYNAIGDGVTDNTEIFKKALEDCGDTKYLYVPFGVFLCENITLNGNYKFVLGAGATIVNKEMVNKL